MRNLIITSLLLISTSSFANSRGQIIDNISRLASRIQVVVDRTEASNADLRVVQSSLNSLLDKLNNRAGTGCLEFTLEIYETAYSGSTALRKAQEACKRITDISLVSYVYNILLGTYNERLSLEKAIDATEGGDYYGKTEELEFIYSKYRSSYSPRVAINKALEKVEVLPSFSMSCLEVSFRSLSRSYGDRVAIDKAIDSCK